MSFQKTHDTIYVVFENDPDGQGKTPIGAYWSRRLAHAQVLDPGLNRSIEAIPVLDNYTNPKIRDPRKPMEPRFDPINPIDPLGPRLPPPPITRVIDPLNPSQKHFDLPRNPNHGLNFKNKKPNGPFGDSQLM